MHQIQHLSLSAVDVLLILQRNDFQRHGLPRDGWGLVIDTLLDMTGGTCSGKYFAWSDVVRGDDNIF